MAQTETARDSVKARVTRLVELADQLLPTMLNDSTLFCHHRHRSSPERLGESTRYSIMVALGLLQSGVAGRSTTLDPEPILDAVRHQRKQLGIGDTALLLWAETRSAQGQARPALIQLEQLAQAPLNNVLTMEIAWWAIAAAEAEVHGLLAKSTLSQAIAELDRRTSPSGLIRHLGHGVRAYLPNFASQIYTLLAWSKLAQHELCSGASERAVTLANELVRMQQSDGGWPWLYHSELSRVVEPYELYSVHQDAMAPMALLTLTEATGDFTYARAALDGLAWCYGTNALNTQMIDVSTPFICRSIRRRRLVNRLNLSTNVALSSVLKLKTQVNMGGLEVFETCRPYHLGWIMEAWSGRESLIEAALGAQP